MYEMGEGVIKERSRGCRMWKAEYWTLEIEKQSSKAEQQSRAAKQSNRADRVSSLREPPRACVDLLGDVQCSFVVRAPLPGIINWLLWRRGDCGATAQGPGRGPLLVGPLFGLAWLRAYPTCTCKAETDDCDLRDLLIVSIYPSEKPRRPSLTQLLLQSTQPASRLVRWASCNDTPSSQKAQCALPLPRRKTPEDHIQPESC